MILPPRRVMASSLVCGACSGTMTVHDTPSSRAPNATPCAMLPALAVYTPSLSCDDGIDRIAFSAPRSLNDPIGWRFSSLIQSSMGASTSSRISGVRTAVPLMRSRAAAMSARVGASSWRITSPAEVDHDASSALFGALEHESRRRDVFDGEPQRLEQGDVRPLPMDRAA